MLPSVTDESEIAEERSSLPFRVGVAGRVLWEIGAKEGDFLENFWRKIVDVRHFIRPEFASLETRKGGTKGREEEGRPRGWSVIGGRLGIVVGGREVIGGIRCICAA